MQVASVFSLDPQFTELSDFSATEQLYERWTHLIRDISAGVNSYPCILLELEHSEGSTRVSAIQCP